MTKEPTKRIGQYGAIVGHRGEYLNLLRETGLEESQLRNIRRPEDARGMRWMVIFTYGSWYHDPALRETCDRIRREGIEIKDFSKKIWDLNL